MALQLSISLHILSASSQRLPLAYQTLNDAKLKLISTLTILQQTVVNSIIFELSREYKHVTKGLPMFLLLHFCPSQYTGQNGLQFQL